jgi:hypothetical protein
VLVAFRKSGKRINSIVGNGKRFMAYNIIDRLEVNKDERILRILKKAVNFSDRQRRKLHELWEDSFDWKLCDSWELMEQKLNYMHENPCRGKWNLVENPFEYIHSSAKFYITGEQGIYPITHYMQTEDMDLSL